MNFLHSIKTKLILLTVGTLLILNTSTFLISRIQLTRIINSSQINLYEEKINIIIKEMERAEERLEKTGSREVYVDDFQESFLQNLSRTYYGRKDTGVYPFILDRDLSVILHPDLSRGETSLRTLEEIQYIRETAASDIYLTYRGVEKWYIFETFEPWDWIVVFCVPLKEKYQDINNFLKVQMLTMILFSAFIVPLLILISYSITAPIIELTAITGKIAQGELNQIVRPRGRDEVSLLSHSVKSMQQSIKEKIEDLNHEMSEKTKMEEQLIQARKMDAIGQLAGGVAHDFNNMLAGISGAAQLLEQDDAIKGQNREFVKMILDTADRAAELTGKLLAFGRKRNISTTVVDLHSVIHDTVLLLDRTLDKKINVILEEKAQNYFFSGNGASLQNCLMNLSINAAHAMPDGGDLTLETRNVVLDENYCRYSSFEIEPGPYIELIVRDTGIGIEPEYISKIFEPFYTSKELGKGTGLGLAMVYGTIQDHKGAITVYSETGKGTVFHIYLPLCTDEQTADASPEQSRPVPEITKGNPGRILLVDDEEIIRKTGKPILEMMGFDVVLAENGREGLEKYSRDPDSIQLIITDMIMPEMNGREFFRRIRRINPSCPVILTSGFTKDQDLDQLEQEGLSGFVQKPFRKEELINSINQVLSSVRREESRPVS